MQSSGEEEFSGPAPPRPFPPAPPYLGGLCPEMLGVRAADVLAALLAGVLWPAPSALVGSFCCRGRCAVRVIVAHCLRLIRDRYLRHSPPRDFPAVTIIEGFSQVK